MALKIITCPWCGREARITYEENRVYQMKCYSCQNTMLHEDRSFDRAVEFFEHHADLLQAEKAGQLVVLDEPRKPLVWDDDDHDSILCPSCKHDLMGGFPEAESSETTMYQCPYCGQPIDGTRALTRDEAEAALKGESHGKENT